MTREVFVGKSSTCVCRFAPEKLRQCWEFLKKMFAISFTNATSQWRFEMLVLRVKGGLSDSFAIL